MIENTIAHHENEDLVCRNDLFLLDKPLTFDEDENLLYCLAYYVGNDKG